MRREISPQKKTLFADSVKKPNGVCQLYCGRMSEQTGITDARILNRFRPYLVQIFSVFTLFTASANVNVQYSCGKVKYPHSKIMISEIITNL